MAKVNNKKSLNILLVNPSQEAAYGKMTAPSQMPMGLAYIAAVLEKEGHNVRALDMDAEKLSPEDFTGIIMQKKYDMAGFTVTTPTLSSALELAGGVKKNSPGTMVVFGGIHPTIKPRETVAFKVVDIVVKGEGEITLKEIARNVASGGDLQNVEGIVYKKGNEIKETSPRPLMEDLDSLPFPARHFFKNKSYTYPDALYRKTVPMITSRGCPGMCTFCNAHQIFTRVFRARSAKNIVDEVELLVKQTGVKEIHIWDDNFITAKKRVLEVRDEIKNRRLRVKFAFPNGIRADFLTPEIIKALKEMGTYSIAIGVESASPEVLKKARKGISPERIKEAFRLAKEEKIETWAFFIIGLPGENENTVKETIDFAKSVSPDIAKFHILKPYPGTEVYDYLSSKNFILTEDYDQFGIHTPPVHRLERFSPADMLRWQKKAYKNFYFNPKTIFKQILRIKTFNRLKVNLKAAASLVKMLWEKE